MNFTVRRRQLPIRYSSAVTFSCPLLRGKLSLDEWARKAYTAYRRWRADRIIAEKNICGNMVQSVLRSVVMNVP